MMDDVWFENDAGRVITPRSEFGLLLVSFDAPTPAPKIVTVDLDGADGSLDMTEWSGRVNYENRKVNIALRDMTGTSCKEIISMLTGRRWRVTHTAEPDYYYDGRVESVTPRTRDRVTDLSIVMKCKPYKLARSVTRREYSYGTTAQNITLRADRMPVIPAMTLTAGAVITCDGAQHSVDAVSGYKPSWLVLSDEPKTLNIVSESAGKMTLTWRDGVL